MSDADIHSSVILDRSEGKVSFVRTQDVEPILDDNKALEQIPQSG